MEALPETASLRLRHLSSRDTSLFTSEMIELNVSQYMATAFGRLLCIFETRRAYSRYLHVLLSFSPNNNAIVPTLVHKKWPRLVR
jgi:hypothetical protein